MGSIYEHMLNWCAKSMTCVQTNTLAAPIGELVLEILDMGATGPKFQRGPDHLQVAGAMDNARICAQI